MRKFALAIVLLILVVPACAMDIDEVSPSVDSVAISSTAGNNEDASGSSQNEMPYPMLPNLNEYSFSALDFDPEDRFQGTIDFEYALHPAPLEFIQAVQELDKIAYLKLLDMYNFFPVGEYVLFYTMETSAGPSRILLEHPSGEVSELYQSTQPIMSVSLSKNRGKIYVEHVTNLGGDGFVGTYRVLNLFDEELSDSDYLPSLDSMEITHKVYFDKHFFIEYEPRMLSGDNTSAKIYCENTEAEYELILTDISWYRFNNGKIYYFDSEKTVLYVVDITSGYCGKVYAFSQAIKGFYLTGNNCLVSMDEKYFSLNMGSGTLREIRYFPDSDVFFVGNGYYSKEPASEVLEFTSCDNTRTVVFGNTSMMQTFAVLDEWLYFRSYHRDVVNCYIYWKVKLDGTGLTRLS